tara:strand:- start:296 stop:601 length:306 start_codon:yes stop_codon:yes gene_type:complete
MSDTATNRAKLLEAYLNAHRERAFHRNEATKLGTEAARVLNEIFADKALVEILQTTGVMTRTNERVRLVAELQHTTEPLVIEPVPTIPWVHQLDEVLSDDK